jgi:hypothetical protein
MHEIIGQSRAQKTQEKNNQGEDDDPAVLNPTKKLQWHGVLPSA